jgi:hypothetical protein
MERSQAYRLTNLESEPTAARQKRTEDRDAGEPGITLGGAEEDNKTAQEVMIMNESHTTHDTQSQEQRRPQRVVVAPQSTPAPRSSALNWGLGIWTGFVATVAITLVMYWIPPLMGMPPMDIGTTLGTMLAQPGPTAFWLGMAWHFVNGILFTLIYAGVLLALQKQSTAGTGAWFGAILWLIGPMLLMPVMMAKHPLVQAGQMVNPGFFMLNMGMGLMPALFDLVAHLVYGVIAGSIYRHTAGA